jgi:hypothetical protein
MSCDDYAVEIQKENEIIKWSVREYALAIKHQNQLVVVVILLDRNDVKYVRSS